MFSTTKSHPIISRKVILGKEGKFEVRPDFPEHAVYFHPLPEPFQAMVKEGLTVFGHFGRAHDSGKFDKRGKRIFTKYFIPSRITI